MARLPQSGGDSGNWGNILNDYLSQAHKTDGTLKDDSVGVAQLKDEVTASFASRTQRLSHIPAIGLYFPEAEGAVADGTTDDSAAIIAAEAAALAAGGTLHMQGEYALGTQVKIRCDADMRRATLNWLGGASSG